MSNLFLHEELSVYKAYADPVEIPQIILNGLSTNIVLREYQEEAFRSFIINFNRSQHKQIHNLFHMATGERVIIVMGAINVLESRVSGTLIKYNSCIA